MFQNYWRRLLKLGSKRCEGTARRQSIRPSLERLEDRVTPAAYIVTNTLDDGSAGSLRWAINQADAASSATWPGIISFNIPAAKGAVATINLGSALPAITNPLTTIAGYGEGNFQFGGNNYSGPPLIRLNGSGAGAGANGIVLSGASSCLVYGLIIDNFSGAGIAVEGGGGNQVFGNYIGTDGTGATSQANGTGVLLTAGTGGNTIGSTSSLARNVISGNANGIRITGGGTTGNIIEGNYIGTNAAGTAALANAQTGVYISAGTNVIGGTASGAGNLISGNGFGIAITNASASTTGNVVQGNYIGTDAFGNVAIPNGDGIEIFTGTNTIGGTGTGARNIISGNGDGIFISGGVVTSGNVVQDNYIGTNAAGSAAIPNSIGVHLGAAGNNTIGGTVTGAGNLISGNTSAGIFLDVLDGLGSTGVLVQGNDIGTDVTGSAALSNGTGIEIYNGSDNTIGGTDAAAANIISGNSTAGIILSGAHANVVEGNFIGTDITGTFPDANGVGVQVLNGASGNTVGGAAAGAGNLISSNQSGVELSGASTADNLVDGNNIGTKTGLNGALGNATGVFIHGGAIDNFIKANTIGGNTFAVSLQEAGTSGNLVQNNAIGTDLSGHAVLPNNSGVTIGSGASGNVIGSTLDGNGGGNIIAYNYTTGVTVEGASSIDNAILSNSIFANDLLGIDLGGDGVTANGAPGRSGPNNLQNYPVFTGYSRSGTITGTLNGAASHTFRIEFFANANIDPSGHGQGQDYLGFVLATTDNSGNASFTFSFSPQGNLPYISATATDASGNTSEFSGAPLSIAVAMGAATERVAFHGTVATFQDQNPKASNFTATINWGDGSSSQASTAASTISAGPNGTFLVLGNHTFTEEAAADDVTVTVTDADPTGGNSASGGIMIPVADAPFAMGNSALNAVAGAPFSGVLGSFIDAGNDGTTTDYTATIVWGDGTTTNGTFAPTGSGSVAVSGTHTYAQPGGYALQVKVTDLGGSSATAFDGVTVTAAGAPLSVALTPIAATEGVPFSGTVATINDTNPKANNFTATINWGDGTSSPASTAAGSIVPGPNNTFLVQGAKTYTEEAAADIVTVTVSDGSNSAGAEAAIAVADAPFAMGNTVFNTPIEVPFTGILGSFIDTGNDGTTADYAATIVWGDGTTTSGTLTRTGSGSVAVTGTHTYTQAGSYALQVKVTDQGGSSATAFDSITAFKQPTTINISSSGPTVFGEPTTFTATVAPPAGGSGTPTGAVTFIEDGLNEALAVTLVGGQATFVETQLTAGSHAISAIYYGDSYFAGSSALPFTQVVAKDTTAVTMTSTVLGSNGTSISSSKETSVIGHQVILRATVTALAPGAGIPTGSVAFVDAGMILGTSMLDQNGTVAFATADLVAGAHPITAVYSGDMNFLNSASTPFVQKVGSPNQRFVAKVFQDLLGQKVDKANLSLYSTQLNKGASRAAVVRELTKTIRERVIVKTAGGPTVTQQIINTSLYRGAVAQNIYNTLLIRDPEPAELAGAQTFLAVATNTDEKLEANVAATAEFFADSGNTNQGFLNAFFQATLNRLPLVNESSTFLSELSGGKSRSAVAMEIMTNSTQGNEYQTDLVNGWYVQFLGRQPTAADAAQIASYVNMLQTGAHDEQVIAAILGSAEYSSGL
jgi:hypothetical protein